jgi:localization factor PodJL
MLNDQDYPCGTEDGVMGPNTRSCIRSFQKANGLDATGEVDDTTYEAMLERR